MMEIERKILGIDLHDLVKRIEKLVPRPQKLFSGLVRVFYYDFPDGRIKKKKDLLRLREFVPSKKSPLQATYLEFIYKQYKGIKKNTKYLEETDLTPPHLSLKEMRKFLKDLGLVESLYYEKKRTVYEYKKWPHTLHASRAGAWKFEIDQHPKIPPFLEIEGSSPEEIEKAIQLLGLQNHEQTADSISQLIKRKYPKISLNGLVFVK